MLPTYIGKMIKKLRLCWELLTSVYHILVAFQLNTIVGDKIDVPWKFYSWSAIDGILNQILRIHSSSIIYDANLLLLHSICLAWS